MQQEQDMPTLINKKPFFSIIIPCYNSRKTLPTLLDSIVMQKMNYNDIQVILSDDCSTESYQDIVDKYKDLLYITQTKTDYNYCPGNTRQKGLDIAQGEWIIFSDHDDEFIPDSFKIVKKTIEEQKIDTVLFAKFVKRNTKGELIQMPVNAGWTHGKFLNLNFLKKYNIHYIKDMTSHEDVCLSTQLEYVRQTYNLTYYEINKFVYIWNQVPNSLSNRKYTQARKERIFLDVFLIDYIESTAGISYTMYQKTKKNKEWVKQEIIKVLLYSYFYSQYAMDVVPEYLEKNFNHIRKYLILLNNQFNYSIEKIYKFFKITHKEQYPKIFSMAVSQTDRFLYQRSFKEWLKWIWNEDYKRHDV